MHMNNLLGTVTLGFSLSADPGLDQVSGPIAFASSGSTHITGQEDLDRCNPWALGMYIQSEAIPTRELIDSLNLAPSHVLYSGVSSHNGGEILILADPHTGKEPLIYIGTADTLKTFHVLQSGMSSSIEGSVLHYLCLSIMDEPRELLELRVGSDFKVAALLPAVIQNGSWIAGAPNLSPNSFYRSYWTTPLNELLYRAEQMHNIPMQSSR